MMMIMRPLKLASLYLNAENIVDLDAYVIALDTYSYYIEDSATVLLIFKLLSHSKFNYHDHVILINEV